VTAWLTIDGGGSGSRARLVDSGGAATTVRGAALSLTRTDPAELLPRVERLLDPLGELPAGTRASVGLAGIHARRSEAIAEWLRRRLRSEQVVVARDVDLVLCHLEGHGAALVAGTGAVAVGRGPAGEVVVDGEGFPRGDRGGAAWLGLEAVRAGLLDAGGVDERDAAGMAALAPAVLARAGEPAAGAVIDRAVGHLTASARTALAESGAGAGAPIVATGGLLDSPPFADRLQSALGPALRRVDPLDARLT